MAKKARDFFQSLAELMKGYLTNADEDVKSLFPPSSSSPIVGDAR